MIDLANFEALIFDFGGVILDIDPDKTWKAFAAHVSDDKIKTILNSGLLQTFEKGSISSKELMERVNRVWGTQINEKDFLHAWNAMLVQYQPPRIEYIQELKKTHRLFLLSNTNTLHFEYFSQKLIREFGVSFNDLFEKVYVSHEMGLIKPDLEIYQQVIAEQGLIPEKTLFIEDTQENADAASELGIQTLVIPRNGSFYSYFKS